MTVIRRRGHPFFPRVLVGSACECHECVFQRPFAFFCWPSVGR